MFGHVVLHPNVIRGLRRRLFFQCQRRGECGQRFLAIAESILIDLTTVVVHAGQPIDVARFRRMVAHQLLKQVDRLSECLKCLVGSVDLIERVPQNVAGRGHLLLPLHIRGGLGQKLAVQRRALASGFDRLRRAANPRLHER